MNLILNFRDGSSYTIERSIVISRDIIATATSTVSKGRSVTQSSTLYPYAVYNGTYKSNGLVELDIGKISFDVSEEAEEFGWSYNTPVLLYVIPTTNIGTLFDDIEAEGGAIDVDYGVYPEITRTHKSNTVFIANVDGIDVSYRDNPTTLNGTDYYWMTSNELQTSSSLNYTPNHSRADLIPGHTYQINAEYLENNKYERSENIGELQMLKCDTTTTISGNNVVNAGENLTLTIIVQENKNNTSLSRGYLTVYDGNNIVQSNHLITGNGTQITFNSAIPGTHDIYAIYTDSGVEYNSSSSNHLQVLVNQNKEDVNISVNEILSNSSNKANTIHTTSSGTLAVGIPFGESVSISGTVTDANDTPLENITVILQDYDNVNKMATSTDSEGMFTCEYEFSSQSANHQNIRIISNETTEYNPESVPIIITNDYLPNFTVFDIFITPVNGTRTYFVAPFEKSIYDFQQEEVYISQLLQEYSKYNYLGIIEINGIISQDYEKIYSQPLGLDNGIYNFYGYIDPQYVLDSEQHFMFLATVEITNSLIIDSNILYDDDANEALAEPDYQNIAMELANR